ncbi:hypothetical protein C3941_23670 [Kaistia algarum]|uniref:hypothetical protein n=1 Tax=Kaistia algarum TaxID=2083279 RepID=UPI000CE82B65|nr:hypothetical protein [Kaistia algarum]MCX5513442.1 hypothetical protein [Kaistia algarum]PPE77459.1 hypothetical protein C3941_23670 [Kaistia algarum]
MIILGVALASLFGCGTVITVPTIVKMPDGSVLRGTSSATMTVGQFSVTNAENTLTCSGTYNPMDASHVITVPLSCSDGRTGTAKITRTLSGMAGSGTATMSDGTIANVAFGEGLTADKVTAPPSAQPQMAR